MTIALLGGSSNLDRGSGTRLGTVSNSPPPTGFGVKVLLDGATTTVPVVVPQQLQHLLFNPQAAGARVAVVRVGGKIYVTDVLTGGRDSGPNFLTLVNSWVNYDSGTTSGGSGRSASWQQVNGVVHLGGVIRTGTSGTVAFQMPVGTRMLVKGPFEGGWEVLASGGAANVTMDASTGDMTVTNQTGNASAFCYLTGITWVGE